MLRSYGLGFKCLALMLVVAVWAGTFMPYVMAFDVGYDAHVENVASEYAEMATTPGAVLVPADATAFSFPEPSAYIVESGLTGTVGGDDRAPWRLYSDGTLVVDSGFIFWSDWWTGGPWESHRNYIFRIIFTGQIIAGNQLTGLF